MAAREVVFGTKRILPKCVFRTVVDDSLNELIGIDVSKCLLLHKLDLGGAVILVAMSTVKTWSLGGLSQENQTIQ
jgi:hypothetical protein